MCLFPWVYKTDLAFFLCCLVVSLCSQVSWCALTADLKLVGKPFWIHGSTCSINSQCSGNSSGEWVSFSLSLIVNYLLILIKIELWIYNSIGCLDYETQRKGSCVQSVTAIERVVYGLGTLKFKELLIFIITWEAWGTICIRCLFNHQNS